MFSNRLRGIISTLVLLSALFSLTTVFAAEPPKITLAPLWHPGTTLDSIDSAPVGQLNGLDDFRYVDVDIYVTTTVQFWSVQLTCTASPTALTSYDNPSADGDPNNGNDPVIWGTAWGNPNTDYVGVVDPYNATTGARTFTASRLGNGYPMGGPNGTRDIFLLATLRYRAKDVAANTTATFTCTSTFLNRNGNPVLVATYTPPPALPVITGYTASGTVLYQGRTAHAGITVDCDYWGDSSKDFSVLTTATGAWTQPNLRAQGYYSCSFFGDTVAPITLGYKPDRYLGAHTSFELKGLSYTMLPVTLAGGNVNFDSTDGNATTADEIVNFSDIITITQPTNWNKAVTAGDVNGDGKTNQVDLTIAAVNNDARETTDSRHIMYGIARDYDVWQHTRVWMGGVNAGTTTSVLATPAGDVKDMWPTLSPDGKQLAFIRNIVDSLAATPEMGLYIAPLTNGVAGTPVLVTPANADYYALSPSWSPDGTRIAFVCSWYDNGDENAGDADGIASGYLVDEGNLCVIDTNGRNFRNFSQVFNVWDKARTRIYPPTWVSNNEIIYGGAWGNGICENTLCYANIQYNDFQLLDADILTGSASPFKVADMPVVRWGTLFYRFYDQSANSYVIRWADLTWGTYPDVVAPFETRSAPAFPFHMVVDFDTDGDGLGTTYLPLNDSVDYFNVSTTDENIILYDSDTSEFQKSYIKSHDGVNPAEWWSPYGGYVDDIVSNPFNPYHTPYNPNDASDYGSPFYAHRNTAEWLP